MILVYLISNQFTLNSLEWVGLSPQTGLEYAKNGQGYRAFNERLRDLELSNMQTSTGLPSFLGSQNMQT